MLFLSAIPRLPLRKECNYNRTKIRSKNRKGIGYRYMYGLVENWRKLWAKSIKLGAGSEDNGEKWSI